MAVRRRLIFWLLKAYIKKWGKTILFFFLAGCVIFFLLAFFAQSLIARIPVFKRETIGILGDRYEVTNLPLSVQKEFAKGLTYISSNGEPKPDIVSRWEIQNEGKKYVFHLRGDLHFTDGSQLSSNAIVYNFSDAQTLRPDKNTLVFSLKESYAPFLTTLSKPFYKSGLVGMGNYKVKDIDINGTFVRSITLAKAANEFVTKTYRFFPNEDQLKLRFVLGDVSKVLGLSDISFKNTTLQSFTHVVVSKKVNHEKLVTIFFNTQDPVVSDKKLREGLSYVLPDQIKEGERSYIPYPMNSWAFEDYSTSRKEDLEHAKILIDDAATSSKTDHFALIIKTFPQYKNLARQIVTEWKKVGVSAKIVEVDTVPSDFQVFLGFFQVSTDPDQYGLWHSNQEHNITHYENKRIDKLLEDGRKTTDIAERKKIYSDFLKYFLADSPATFLYFPYEYDVERK